MSWQRSTAALIAAATTVFAPGAPAAADPTGSMTAAYTFLDQMMDQHATGSTLRLPQSFTGGYLQKVGYTDSVTYDDALVVDALLARGTTDDLSRARVLGNALLYMQANDAKKDGRIRAAYAPNPLTSPSKIDATDATSDVGNMAWVGQALVQLYGATGDADYLNGATKIGTWIQTNAVDTRGHGGYTGGFDDKNTKITWKSTEHNLDVYALFSMLATATGNATWTTRAAAAHTFVVSMWDSVKHLFWTGTGTDGTTTNTDFIPEDTQTWSYLALKDPAYASSIDYAIAKLKVTDGAFTGVSFSSSDRTKVWFEGTAHLADALEFRAGSGDAAKATAYTNNIELAQTTAPNNDRQGIVAASHDGLKTGDGDKYYASLHTGATAWYLLALRKVDPFYPITVG
ncbi:MAG TPA: hypothetical protein VGN81_38165 [Pseudonocardiaceae bacterium]